MSLLSARDYKQLLEACGILYSLTDRHDVLAAVCEWLGRTIRIPSAVLVPANHQTGAFQFDDNFLFNNQANVFTQYLSHYGRLDPLATDGWILRFDNSVSRYSDFISPARLAESEYGRDFLPQIPMFHCLCATLGHQGVPVGALGLHRKKTDGTFTDREKEIVSLLAPHLSQALHHILLLDTIADLQGTGIVVMGNSQHPLYLNEEARLALNGKSVSEIPDPALYGEAAVFRTNGKSYRVRSAPLTSSKTSALAHICSVERPSMKRAKQIILLEPLPARWTLTSKLRSFELSPRQEEIATLIVQGFSNREIAERLFICEQTVKDHLRDVFHRMKIRRRGELVAKLLGIHHAEQEEPK